MAGGVMVLSFDFELAWGSRTCAEDNGRGRQFARSGEVVEQLLEILVRHEISATWAVVGHLMLRPEDCPQGRYHYPLPPPDHAWFAGDWYDGIPPVGTPEAAGYYAPDSIAAIVECPVYQELAGHTFSHVHCAEPGCSAEVAAAEFRLSQQLAGHWGRVQKSLVFPRNGAGHLAQAREAGYKCYRGRNAEWYWFGRPAAILRRQWLRAPVSALRYVDERFCLCPPLPPLRLVEGLWEIPHSMFFPGFQGISKVISSELRWRRACAGLHRAAERGRIFSIFTHPHNLLPQPERLLPSIERICTEAARLREQDKLQILTMQQVVQEVEAGRGELWTEPNPRRRTGPTGAASDVKTRRESEEDQVP